MTRILSFSSGYYPCGVRDYNRHLVEALSRRVVCETVEYPTTRIPRHKVGALLQLRRTYLELAARSDDFDLVLMHFASKYWNGGRPLENTLPLFVDRIRRPIVMVLHEWPALVGVGHHGGPRWRQAAVRAVTSMLAARDTKTWDYVDWHERRLFAAMSHVIVHTPELEGRLVAAGVDRQRITSLPFPLHETATSSPPPAVLASRLGIDGRRALLLLGVPVPRKGFEDAVVALARLPRDVVLVLVCSERTEQDRAHVEALRASAVAHGVADRLITTGFLDDSGLASMFRIVELAVAPFTQVTGSSSIANCFAAGLAVVTTDLPPMVQARDDGAGVELVRPSDPTALATTLGALLDDRERLGALRERTRRYAERHTFAQLADRVIAIATQIGEARAS